MYRGLPLLLSTASALAPFQCTTDPDPARALEETPAEAMYQLAAHFKKEGNLPAWRQTLEYLVDRYPASRFAVTARQDLDDAQGSGGGPPP